MHKLILVLLFALTVDVAAQDRSSAQVPGSLAGEQRCGFAELYQSEGWSIPGLPGAQPKAPRVAVEFRKEGVEDIVRPGFFATSLKAVATEKRLLVLKCSQEAPGRLAVRNVHVKVLELWQFDVKGKVFAYGVRYEPQYESGGTLHRSLEYVQVIFYDTDGSGRFTAMSYQSANLFQSVKIPEWVKRSTELK